MLQQAPESKCLPLHSIHGRRFPTRDFDYSAPDTTSHASSTAFTKTERSTMTLATPVVHCGMYYDNHQALYHDKPLELATTLWPPETTNYWFPNWKELFHGFLVLQKGQTREALVAESEQRGSSLCIQQQKSGCPSRRSSTHFVHLGSDNANTSIPWVPSQQSQQHRWTYTNVHQHKPGSPPRCSTTQSVHLGSDNATTFNYRISPFQQSQQPHLQVHTNVTTQPPLPIPTPSHDGPQSPAKQQEKDQTQIGETNKACSSPIQAPGIVTTRSIKSPVWLPPGWITEIHMRRTGATAGTRDKYFKHLASGRRFRSRKDVLHFTSTGKGRARKHRGNKAPKYSAGYSLLKTFAHKKLSILENLKPFPHSCSENEHSTHVANSLVLGLSEPGCNDVVGLPCKQLNSLCSRSGIHPPSKESAIERSHESLVNKRAKILPSQTGEDKQASKLCQWLTKPVARNNCTSLSKEVLTVSFSRPDVEKVATETVDERSAKDLSLTTQSSHRASQLNKEIQAAQDNMVQMSREMQAAAAKLSQEILVATKDVESRHHMQVFQVPTESFCMLADKSQAGNGYKPRTETISKSPVTSSADNQAYKTVGAANRLPNPAHFSSFVDNSVICKVPGPDHTGGVSKGFQAAATLMPETCSSFKLHVNYPTTWAKVIQHPEVQMVKTAHVSLEAQTTHRVALSDAIHHQAQTAVVESPQKHAFSAELISSQTERSPLVKDDGNKAVLQGEVPTIQTQKLLPIVSGSIMKAVDACASTYCEAAEPVDNVTTGMHTGESHVLVTSRHLKQPGELPEFNDAQAVRRQTRSMDSLARVPVTMREQAPLWANASVKSSAGILSSGAQGSGLYSGMPETSDSKQDAKCQQIDEIEARRLRRKKFSAVLNPKLDLSRLSPSLTTRQKAKVVEKMKARHARELLATLGKHICRKAVRSNYVHYKILSDNPLRVNSYFMDHIQGKPTQC